ncbi:MAG: DUF4859 domain-containing protein [Bacteroidaceae bacterium]|nr:DUF4859 domain-containing protein [Bacteroidaceae bacterium]
MKKVFYYIGTMLLALVGSTHSVHAQFSGEVEAFPNTDWTPVYVYYDLAEVAMALGYQSGDELADALEESVTSFASGGIPEVAVTNLDSNGNPSTNYTANYYRNGIYFTYGCFWLDADSRVTSWGENNIFWSQIDWNAEENVLVIGLGQMAYLNGGTGCSPGSYTAETTLTHGEYSVTLNSTLTVIAPPDMPDPTTNRDNLEIIETVRVEVSQPVMTNWGTNPYWTVDARSFIETTGADINTLAVNVSKIFYAQVWDSENEKISSMLSNEYSANGCGFWFVRSMSEEEGSDQLTEYCIRGVYGSSDFFIENTGCSVNDSVFYGWAGQMINRFKGGEHFYTDLYFVYGNKALKVEFHFNVEKDEEYKIDDMEGIGQDSLTWCQEPRASYAGLKKWLPNLDEICELLGCSASNIKMKCLQPNNTLAEDYTTSSGSGFWLDATGSVVERGASTACFYVEFDKNKGAFEVGQMPSTLEAGQELKATIWLCYKEKYYAVEISLTIKDIALAEQEDYYEVARYSFDLQSLVNDTWDVDQMGEALDMQKVRQLLGTDDYVVYAKSDGFFTRNYTCTPYPGFWFTPAGTVVTWGDAQVGMVFERDHVQAFKNPGSGIEVGDNFLHYMYLVNEETGAYITLEVNVRFVEKIVSYIIVAEETFVFDTKNLEANEWCSQSFDIQGVFKALKTDTDGFIENGNILPRTGEGKFAAPGLYDGIYIFTFDSEGNVLPDGSEKYAFAIEFEIGYEDEPSNLNVIFTEDGYEAFTANSRKAATAVAFQMAEKRYVLNINLSDATPAIVTMTDITSLIDEYLEEGSTVQLNEITELIDRYLEQ